MKSSENIQELAKALAKFQGEVANPKNTASNPFFNSKYAPLAGIIDATKEALAKNGLSVVQSPAAHGGMLYMSTMLLHTSGEWIESGMLAMTPDKETPQSIGSAITYARRYQLSAILGVSSEDDDDGNAAEPQTAQKPSHERTQQRSGGAPRTKGGATIKSVDYVKSLFVEAGIAIGGAKDEDDEKKQARRDNNKLAVSEWLRKEGWDVPENAEDPLEHFGWEDVSTMIDMLKARMEKLNE